ncbi:MAG: hypothetical protein JW993_16100 [Sedimentisphaerales bacterium]|nr:hypothetical protein [Sedimentisphaerales bacterium]
MKTLSHAKVTHALYVVSIMSMCTPALFAYPPDNAAVLYYQASLTYDANYPMLDKVTQFIRGDIGVDEEIEAYVRRNARAIKQFVDAGASPQCDWGIDYSEGLDVMMPQYAPLRNIAKIVLAEARIAGEAGDYARALDLCLAVHKAGVHIADGGIIISHLVAISLNEMANQCLTQLIPHVRDAPDLLVELRSLILDVSGGIPSVKTAINRDLHVFGGDLRRERVGYILEMVTDFGITAERARIIRQADEAFFNANRQYFMGHLAAVLAACDLPYPQSYERLVALGEEPALESKTNPDAILAAVLAPAVDKIVCLDLKARTHFNAVGTALNLYLVRARTGRLPETLPEGMPKDLFSGKDFEYERDAAGFVLRCQAKDLAKDQTYEYRFTFK